MPEGNNDFRERYKVHPVRVKAVSDFKCASNFSFSSDVRKYMYQFMAIVGLELETRFNNIVVFEDNQFRLFGREKSEISTANKRVLNIEDYDRVFKSVLETGNEHDLPTRVRPIYDYYAFKLVCPEIKNISDVIHIVILDILKDIRQNHPEYMSQINDLINCLNSTYLIPLNFIDSEFSSEYPGLKNMILSITDECKGVSTIQNFLDNSNLDVSRLTYSDYFTRIIECYQILIELSYEESVEEYVRIAQEGINAREEFSALINNGKSNELIDSEVYEDYEERLNNLLEHISRKKTNKLDLALSNLMVFDVLYTSKKVKQFGVKVSQDPTRTKKKRNPNGYIADFYSLDMPNGLTSEIQLQSLYRYTYGENGPAAHNKMENGIKKRTLYPMPKEKREYKEWAHRQFRALPKYFRYLGHGFVQVYSTLQNFRRYYDTEKPEEIQAYVRYIVDHDVDQLDSDILHFSLDDSPVLLKNEESESR